MPVQLMNSTLIPLCTISASAWASQLVTHSSQPQGEEVRGKRAKFLCLEDSAPYVARGLLQILQPKDSQFLPAASRTLTPRGRAVCLTDAGNRQRCWRTKALYRPAIKRVRGASFSAFRRAHPRLAFPLRC